jgi:hypothetical protein
MGRLRSICSHPQRKAVDLALMQHVVGYRLLAARFGLAYSSLRRHEANHLRLSWELSKGLGAMLSANNLLEKLAELDTETREMLIEARTAGDIRTALVAVRESRSNIESFAHIGPLSDVEQRLAALEQRQEADHAGNGTDHEDDASTADEA